MKIADPYISTKIYWHLTNLPGSPYMQNMSHKKAWVHTVPFVVEHWAVGMKSTKAARVILWVSILLISLRAADMVHALQAEDLWAWTWKGGNLNTTDTVSFFFSFHWESVMFQIGTFQHFATGKKGGWEGSRGNKHKKHPHTNTHTFLLARMSHSRNGKKWPHSLPVQEKKWCVRDFC